MKIRKQIFAAFAAVFMFVSLLVPAFSSKAYYESDATIGYVTDAAEILTESERNLLAQKAERISQQYGIGVYIVIVWDYLDYMDTSRYSDIKHCTEQIYDMYHLGLGEDKDAEMLMLSMKERDYDLMAHGPFGNMAFTDYGKEMLDDEFLDDFRYDDWYTGFNDYLDESERYIIAAKNGDPIDNPNYGGTAPIGSSFGGYVFRFLVIPFGIALIVCLILKGMNKSVRKATEANRYVTGGGPKITQRYDMFTHRTQTRTKIQTNSGSGGSHGTTISSHGSSHHSGKF